MGDALVGWLVGQSVGRRSVWSVWSFWWVVVSLSGSWLLVAWSVGLEHWDHLVSMLAVLEPSLVSCTTTEGEEALRLQVVAAQNCIHLSRSQAANHQGPVSTFDLKRFLFLTILAWTNGFYQANSVCTHIDLGFCFESRFAVNSALTWCDRVLTTWVQNIPKQHCRVGLCQCCEFGPKSLLFFFFFTV